MDEISGVVSVERTVESSAAYRLVHQLVCLSSFDFQSASFKGFTELTIVPLSASLSSIRLNCGTAVRICSITANDRPVDWRAVDECSAAELLARDKQHDVPVAQQQQANNLESTRAGVEEGELLDDETGSTQPAFANNSPPPAARSLRRLNRAVSAAAEQLNAENGGGNVLVNVSTVLQSTEGEQQTSFRILKLGVEFAVARPAVGVRFVCNSKQDAHCFTYRSVVGGSSTRYWLPTIDATDQLALWTIQITVDKRMTAVSAGELLETERTSNSKEEKTFYYQLNIPTSAMNIGFAIGPFELHVHPEMSEVTHFCLPTLLPLLKQTVRCLNKAIEFFEELLIFRFPYATYKQVFVDQAADELTCFAGLTVFSTSLLYHRRIIDVPVPHSRKMMAYAVGQQFFSCFITYGRWTDSWLVRAIPKYLNGLYVEKTFGNSEFRYLISRTMEEVCDFETAVGPLFLRPISDDPKVRSSLYFNPCSAETTSPEYAEMLAKKGLLVLRMLEQKLRKEQLLQVLHKLVVVAGQAAAKKKRPAAWSEALLLSTDAFFASISKLTGQELPTFIEQWVYGGGHAMFKVSYGFNRRKNSVELHVQQDEASASAAKNSRQVYLGPAVVAVQEVDGHFVQTIQIDAAETRHELQCHSKGRKQKKKRVPLSNGEEVDVDVSQMDSDSPVIWILFDPDLMLIRKLRLVQPEVHWFYQLKYERDVLAQLQALHVLPYYQGTRTQSLLVETIENEHFFYRVRTAAAQKLAVSANLLLNKQQQQHQHQQQQTADVLAPVVASYSFASATTIMAIFYRMFSSGGTAEQQRHRRLLVRPNRFALTPHSLQNYFIMQALPRAAAAFRFPPNAQYADVKNFIIELIRFNDNSKNRYSDDYYRSTLLLALSETVSWNANNTTGAASSGCSAEVRPVLDELVLALNLEQLQPTYGRVVLMSCLKGLFSLMRRGHIPYSAELFWRYAAVCQQQENSAAVRRRQYQKVRQTAFDLLVELAVLYRGAEAHQLYLSLIHAVLKEDDPGVRYQLAKTLAGRTPFSHRRRAGGRPAAARRQVEGLGQQRPPSNSSQEINTAELAARLWTGILDCGEDSRLRGALIDLYFTLFGVDGDPGGSDVAAASAVVSGSSSPSAGSRPSSCHSASSSMGHLRKQSLVQTEESVGPPPPSSVTVTKLLSLQPVECSSNTNRVDFSRPTISSSEKVLPLPPKKRKEEGSGDVVVISLDESF